LNLDLVNDILKGIKENDFVQDFINDLTSYLENKNEEKPILEEILSKNNITTANENSIRWKMDDVILDYAKENFKDETMYLVNDNKKIVWKNNKKDYNNDILSIWKVENNKIEEIGLEKSKLKEKLSINDVFKIENDEAIIDKIATKELKDKILEMANEIIEKQNNNLSNYKKEGHLYVVKEEIGNNRFLKDITEDKNTEFEEVDIPKEILDKAVEGSVLKYTNGKYEYFSDEGMEIES
jgi:hypothetical protein